MTSFPGLRQPRQSNGNPKEHVEAIKQEVKRLKDAVVIKEVFFLKWLANTVVMKKKNGK